MWILTPKSWLLVSGMRNFLLWHKSNLIKTTKVTDINFYYTFVTLWVKPKIILPGKSEHIFHTFPIFSTWSNPPRINPDCYCHGMQPFGYLAGQQLPIKSRIDVQNWNITGKNIFSINSLRILCIVIQSVTKWTLY